MGDRKTTVDEALDEAKDLLRELIAATIREGRALPDPSRASKRRSLVVPPLQIALKAAFYQAYRQADISQRALARSLGIAENEVRRMLNPDHATKAGTLEAVLCQLGTGVSLTVLAEGQSLERQRRVLAEQLHRSA